MLGATIGDTVGSVYEFINTKNYNFELFTEKSGYTDDTVMTMAVAQWLLSDPAHSFEELEHWMFYFASNCPCINGESEMTHNHPEGIKGTQATFAAIWLARNNKDKSQRNERA